MPFTAVRILGILFDLLQAVTHLADSTFKILVIIEGFKRYSLAEDIAAFVIYGFAALVTGNLFAKHILRRDAPIARLTVSLLGLGLSPFYAVADYLLHSVNSSAENSEQDIFSNHRCINVTSDVPNMVHTLRENASRYTNFLIALDKAIAARVESYFLYKVSAAGSVCFQGFLIIATAVRDEPATTTQLFCIAFSLLNILMNGARLYCRSFAGAFFLATDVLRIAFVILAVFEVSAPNEVGLFGSSSVTVTYWVVAWVISQLLFAFIVAVVFTFEVSKEERCCFPRPVCALLFFPLSCMQSALMSIFVHEWMTSLHQLTTVENSSGGYGLPLLNEFLWASDSTQPISAVDWKRTFENLLQVVKVSPIVNSEAHCQTASSMFRRLHELPPSSSSPADGAATVHIASSITAACSPAIVTASSDTLFLRARHAFLFQNLIRFYENLPSQPDDGETDSDERERHRKKFEIRDKRTKLAIREFITGQEHTLTSENPKWSFISPFDMMFNQLFYASNELPHLMKCHPAILFALQLYLYLDKAFALFFPAVYAIRYFDSFTPTMQLIWYPWCFCCFMSVVVLGPGFFKYYLTCQVYLNYIDRRFKYKYEDSLSWKQQQQQEKQEEREEEKKTEIGEQSRHRGLNNMIHLVDSYYCLNDTHTDISEHEERFRTLLAESNVVVCKMFRVFEQEANNINKTSSLRRISEKYNTKLSERVITKLTDANVMKSGEFKVIDNSRLDEIGIPREDRLKVLNLFNLHKNEESLLRPELKESFMSLQNEKLALIIRIRNRGKKDHWLASANFSMNIKTATIQELQQAIDVLENDILELTQLVSHQNVSQQISSQHGNSSVVTDDASSFSRTTTRQAATIDLKPSAEAEHSTDDTASNSIATSNLVVANQDTRPTGANKIQDSVQGSSESSRKARSQKAPSSVGGCSVVNDDEFNSLKM